MNGGTVFVLFLVAGFVVFLLYTAHLSRCARLVDEGVHEGLSPNEQRDQMEDEYQRPENFELRMKNARAGARFKAS